MRDSASVQMVYNNGLIVILTQIVLLKIANTGDKPPQPVISGYFAIFQAFFEG